MSSQISNRAVLRPKSVLPMPSREWAVGAPELGPAALAQVLAALALVDRIDHQRRHAVQGQQRAHRLVRVVPLGRPWHGRRAPARPDRAAFRIAAGQEQQCRHVVLGLALEDHFSTR